MFFIAYLSEPGTHIVLPVTWVYDYEELIQKFIRKSINSNQKCLVYFSKKTIGGIPNGELDANFTAPTSTTFPIVGEEACFIAKITHYYNLYGDAKAHCDRLRSQPPRLYNEKRLNELPIPNIPSGHENNDTTVSSTNNNDSDLNTSAHNETDLHEFNHSISDEIGRCNEFDGLNISNDSSNENGDSNITSTVENDNVLLPTTSVYLETNENCDTDITPDSSLIDPIKDEPDFNLDSEEQNQLEDILRFNDDASDANLSVIDPSNGAEIESDEEPELVDEDKLTEFPMPMSANLLGLTKREEDPISMSLAFNEKKNGDRIYRIGDVLKVVPLKLLNAIRAWATYPFKIKPNYDAKIVNALLCVLHYKQANSLNEKDAIEQFVKIILGIRIGDDLTRCEKVLGYIKAYID